MVKDILYIEYELAKKYIEELLLSNNKSIEKTTKYIIENTISIEDNNFNYFNLYLNILSDLYDEDSNLFYKNGIPIFINKQDLGLFITIQKILSIVKNTPNKIKAFFQKILSNLQQFDINSLNLIEGEKEKGYCFDYLLYIPQNIKNNTLIVEGNNSPKNLTKGELKNINYISETLPILGSLQFLLDFNTPIFIPLIPNDDSTKNSKDPKFHERYARQLSRNSVNPNLENNNGIKSNGDYIYRTDVQILNAIEEAKRITYERTETILEDKSLLYGFSTSGNLAVRMAFLHPEKFCAVIAGGINAAIPIPFNKYNGINLIYPVGTYDYEAITGKKFDYEVYSNLKQYYFMGENEKPEIYNTVVNPKYHDTDVKKAYSAISLDLYKRVNIINDIYRKQGLDEDRIEIYKSFGHTPQPAVNKIREITFLALKENQKTHNKVK